MRFLILTQYYPPETGAPQNRLSGLARELKALGHEVVVLTAMPNYPAMEVHSSYKGLRYMLDEFENTEVHRSWIYVSKNRSIVSRLLNYFSFTFSSIVYSSKIKGHFDYLMVESPPLFLGISAWWISKRKKAKMVFNVSDLWPESAEKLGVIENRFFLKMATLLEEWLYKTSYSITGQTQGIVQNIITRFPNKMVHWLPNGVDESIFQIKKDTSIRSNLNFEKDDFLIMYAGIIGIAQGLDVILDAAKLIPAESKVMYLLLGDGPEKQRLMQRVSDEKIQRVKFLELVSREVVPSYVDAIDAAVIPLKKMDLFLGAIPSKIFENAALGKPLLLSVDGEARKLFIDEGNAGLYIEPENCQMLADASLQLERNPELAKSMGDNGKNYVQKFFMRKNITKEWLNTLN
ncbi:MAG: glycosyltransferase family 4 protein [Bacteroidota bacterium]